MITTVVIIRYNILALKKAWEDAEPGRAAKVTYLVFYDSV
jgi:hypothetical protein